LDISRVDIRVGKIVDVKVLEGSDKLYIEQIDVGEEKPRQILSGLRLFVPLEEMKDRLVLVVCNLEPRSMAKTLSYGMVLAASNQDHTVVELVNPPPNSKIGERVTFDGYSGEPDTVLNSKKKHFDIIAEDLHTTDACEAAYKTSLFKTSAGICSVKSLKNEKIK